MDQDYRKAYINETHCVAYRDGRLWIQHPQSEVYRLVSNNKPFKSGYLIASIRGKRYKQHRIMYKCFNLDFDIDNSELIIDHIDRNKINNSIVNLRLVTRSQNSHNRGISSINKSGYKGINAEYKKGAKCWRWRIHVKINGEQIRRYRKMDPQPDIKPGEPFDYEKYPVPDDIIQLSRDLREELHGPYHCHGDEPSKPKMQLKLTIKKPL